MLAAPSTTKLLEKLFQAYRQQTGHLPEPPRQYPAGKYVFTEGERPKGIYYINNGWVSVSRESEENHDSVVRLAGPHEFIGYMSLIKRWDYTSSAKVIKEAEIQFIPKPVFLKLLQTDIEFAQGVIETLCIQLTDSQTKIAQLIGKDAKQRLAALLLSLEMAFDEDHDYEDSHIHLPKKDLAAAIAVTPETVSRHLSEFRKKRIIRVSAKQIEILNRSALLRLSKVRD